MPEIAVTRGKVVWVAATPNHPRPSGVSSREAALGASGEVSDFDELFRSSFEPMVRSLALACGDREAAADAVQDAFTRAYARWRRISRYDDPAGWVRHVALNRMRDHFRRLERGRRAVDRLASRTNDAAPAPTEPSDVLTVIGTLPKQQRIAVALFYVEQLSVQEIATAMDVSEGTVKYHLHAGRERLRTHLEQP